MVDTVYCSSKHLTTILFPDKVTYLALGSEDFIGTAEGKTVSVQAATSTPPPSPSTILVKYGENSTIYHGAISYTPIPRNSFLDWSDSNIPKDLNPKFQIPSDSVTLEDKFIVRRIGILEGISKDRFKEYGKRADGIWFSISDLMRDEDYLYVKILVINKSSEEYKIRLVDFEYHTPRKDRSYQPKDDIKPVPNKGSNEVNMIPVKGEKYLVYAIPRYILAEDGFVRVTMRELKGTREFTQDIPHKIIANAKTF